MKHIKSYKEFLIQENYSNKIYTNLLNKHGNDFENIIFIFGLFRNNKPFIGKDITNLSKDEINILYDEWYNKLLSDIMNVDGVLKKNKKDTEIYLNAYITNIKSLKNNAKPIVVSNYEKTLIDVVNNNKWINNNNDISINNIENPFKEDIIYDDVNISIVKGFTKTKCQIYGQGYSWCISQENGNYFSKYRFEDGATIYFVLNKKLEKDNVERLCVILLYPDDIYSIADASNQGSRSGGINEGDYGFDYIQGELPWLNNKKEYFKYIPVTKIEKNYDKFIKESIIEDDFITVLKNYYKLCIENGLDISFDDIFRDYIQNNYLNIKQQHILIKDNNLLDTYFSFGGKPLDKSIFQNLDSKYQMKFLVNRFKNKNVMPNDYGYDLTFLDLNQLKDFISRFNEKDIDRIFTSYFIKSIKEDYIKYFVNLFIEKYDADSIFLITYIEYVDISHFKNINFMSIHTFNSFLKACALKKINIVEYVYSRLDYFTDLINKDISYLYAIYSHINDDDIFEISKILSIHINLYEDTINTLLDFNRKHIDEIINIIVDKLGNKIEMTDILTISKYNSDIELIKDLLNKTNDTINDDQIINIVYMSNNKKELTKFIKNRFNLNYNKFLMDYFIKNNFIDIE